MQPVTASAPGKVLLCGGYLVLQARTPGLVVSTSSRFFSSVVEEPASADAHAGTAVADDPTSPRASVAVAVESPQFRAVWRYRLPLAPPFALTHEGVAGGGNAYAAHAIELALCTACGRSGGAEAVVASLRGVAARGAALRFVLRADNEFYSQRSQLQARGLPLSLASLAGLPRFLPCPCVAEGGTVTVNKTGLGSSAALVTSLVAATLTFFSAAPALLRRGGGNSTEGEGETGDLETRLCERDLLLVHNAAQVAHGLAQGKVGSGFDVCAASFGSILFSRIPPAALGSRMERAQVALHGAEASADAYLALARELEGLGGLHPADGAAPDWSFCAAPFALPAGLSLMLADVAGGSETPSMVRQVLAWRDSCAAAGEADAGEAVVSGNESELDSVDVNDRFEQATATGEARASAEGPPLWRALAGANARVATVVEQMRRIERDLRESGDYAAGLRLCAGAPSSAWTALGSVAPDIAVGAGARRVVRKLAELAAAFAEARRLLRALGAASGVPIEPPAQTALADETLSEAGVAATGIPGAGGFDALFAVIVESEGRDVRSAVEARWLRWGGNGGLTPLPLREGVGGLRVAAVTSPGELLLS